MIIKYYDILGLFVKSLKYFELECLIIFTVSRNIYICKILLYIYIYIKKDIDISLKISLYQICILG